MKKLLVLFVVLFSLSSFSNAMAAESKLDELKTIPSGTYQMDRTHASITWKVLHLGMSHFTARFTDFNATVQLDSQHPEKSSVQVSINPKSIRTDYPYPEKEDFDKELANDEHWFNSNEFPEIKFTSTSIDFHDGNSATINGNLTFLGVTKPFSFEAHLNGVVAEHPYAKKPAFGISAEGDLSRSNWGMTNYVPNVGDNVHLLIEAEFIAAQ